MLKLFRRAWLADKRRAAPEQPANARRVIRRHPELVGVSEQQRTGFAARVGKTTLRLDEPEVTQHSNATIVRGVLRRAQSCFGGVYDEHGQIVGASRVLRGPDAECFCGPLSGHSPVAETHLPGLVVYGGVVFANFGHFVLEAFSRLWGIHLHQHKVPIYVQSKDGKLPEFATRLYQLAGVSGTINVATQDTSFDTVVVPGPSFVARHCAHRVFKDFCLRITDHALGGRLPRVTEQPLYLSRARLDDAHRSLVGEVVLEDVLRRYGFLVVHPETLDLVEQIRLVNTHRFVVAPIGSALHLLLFSAICNEVVCLNRGPLSTNFVLCDALNATRTVYVKTATQPAVLTHPAIVWNSYPELLDLGTALTYLRERGCVSDADVNVNDLAGLQQEYRRRFLLRALVDARRLKNPELMRLAQSLAVREFSGDPQLERLTAAATRALSGKVHKSATQAGSG
jgi:hypothetical protein